MGISFKKKEAIFAFRTGFSLSFAMKFQRRHWLEDFAWRVVRVKQKVRLSRCLFPLCISLNNNNNNNNDLLAIPN
jgi:hypothetical protein